jgi:hypothetical protein
MRLPVHEPARIMNRRAAALVVLVVSSVGSAGSAARQSDAPYTSASRLSEPRLFGEGVISTGEFESHPQFTPDGKTLYFVRSTPEFTDWKIWETRWEKGAWSHPRMAPFSGTYADADPFITPDGKWLYFVSDRPVNGVKRADMDIWRMRRTGTGWSDPENLGAPVNTTGNEWFPTVTKSGALYFGSDRPGGKGGTDLYRSTRVKGGYAEPDNLGDGVNTKYHEYEPYVDAGERYMIFMAARPPAAGGVGGGDLWISRRDARGAWLPATILGAGINTKQMEIGARVSPDGKYLFFSSSRVTGKVDPNNRPNRPGNGVGDIYQIDLSAALPTGTNP